jgi:hypothetical protein
LAEGLSETGIGGRQVGRQVACSNVLVRLLGLSGEWRGEEDDRDARDEAPPVHHSIT